MVEYIIVSWLNTIISTAGKEESAAEKDSPEDVEDEVEPDDAEVTAETVEVRPSLRSVLVLGPFKDCRFNAGDRNTAVI